MERKLRKGMEGEGRKQTVPALSIGFTGLIRINVFFILFSKKIVSIKRCRKASPC